MGVARRWDTVSLRRGRRGPPWWRLVVWLLLPWLILSTLPLTSLAAEAEIALAAELETRRQAIFDKLLSGEYSLEQAMDAARQAELTSPRRGFVEAVLQSDKPPSRTGKDPALVLTDERGNLKAGKGVFSDEDLTCASDDCLGSIRKELRRRDIAFKQDAYKIITEHDVIIWKSEKRPPGWSAPGARQSLFDRMAQEKEYVPSAMPGAAGRPYGGGEEAVLDNLNKGKTGYSLPPDQWSAGDPAKSYRMWEQSRVTAKDTLRSLDAVGLCASDAYRALCAHYDDISNGRILPDAFAPGVDSATRVERLAAQQREMRGAMRAALEEAHQRTLREVDELLERFTGKLSREQLDELRQQTIEAVDRLERLAADYRQLWIDQPELMRGLTGASGERAFIERFEGPLNIRAGKLKKVAGEVDDQVARLRTMGLVKGGTLKRERLPSIDGDDPLLRKAKAAGNQAIREKIPLERVKAPELRERLLNVDHFDGLARQDEVAKVLPELIKGDIEKLPFDARFKAGKAGAAYREMLEGHVAAYRERVLRKRQEYWTRRLRGAADELNEQGMALARARGLLDDALRNNVDGFLLLDAGDILVDFLRHWHEDDLKQALRAAGTDVVFVGLTCVAPELLIAMGKGPGTALLAHGGAYLDRLAVDLGMSRASMTAAQGMVAEGAAAAGTVVMYYLLAKTVYELTLKSEELGRDLLVETLMEGKIRGLYQDPDAPYSFWRYIEDRHHVGLDPTTLFGFFTSVEMLEAGLSSYRASDWLELNSGGLRFDDPNYDYPFSKIVAQARADYFRGLRAFVAAQEEAIREKVIDQRVAAEVEARWRKLRLARETAVTTPPQALSLVAVEALDDTLVAAASGRFNLRLLLLGVPGSSAEVRFSATPQGFGEMVEGRRDYRFDEESQGREVVLPIDVPLPAEPGEYRIKLAVEFVARVDTTDAVDPAKLEGASFQRAERLFPFVVGAGSVPPTAGEPPTTGEGRPPESAPVATADEAGAPPPSGARWVDATPDTPLALDGRAGARLKLYPREGAYGKAVAGYSVGYPLEMALTLPSLELDRYHAVAELQLDASTRLPAGLREVLGRDDRLLAIAQRLVDKLELSPAYRVAVRLDDGEPAFLPSSLPVGGAAGGTVSPQDPLGGRHLGWQGFSIGVHSLVDEIARIEADIAAAKQRLVEMAQQDIRTALITHCRSEAIHGSFGVCEWERRLGEYLGDVKPCSVYRSGVPSPREGGSRGGEPSVSAAPPPARVVDPEVVEKLQDKIAAAQARVDDCPARVDEDLALNGQEYRDRAEAARTMVQRSIAYRGDEMRRVKASVEGLARRSVAESRPTDFALSRVYARGYPSGGPYPDAEGPAAYSGRFRRFVGRYDYGFHHTVLFYTGIPYGVNQRAPAFLPGPPGRPVAAGDRFEVLLYGDDGLLATHPMPLLDEADARRHAADETRRWFARLADLRERVRPAGGAVMGRLAAALENLDSLTGEAFYARLGMAREYADAVEETRRETAAPSRASITRVERLWDRLFGLAEERLEAMGREGGEEARSPEPPREVAGEGRTALFDRRLPAGKGDELVQGYLERQREQRRAEGATADEALDEIFRPAGDPVPELASLGDWDRVWNQTVRAAAKALSVARMDLAAARAAAKAGKRLGAEQLLKKERLDRDAVREAIDDRRHLLNKVLRCFENRYCHDSASLDTVDRIKAMCADVLRTEERGAAGSTRALRATLAKLPARMVVDGELYRLYIDETEKLIPLLRAVERATPRSPSGAAATAPASAPPSVSSPADPPATPPVAPQRRLSPGVMDYLKRRKGGG